MTTPAVAALILQIEVALRPLADARQAVPMRAYMLDQFAFLGIRATPRRQALRGLPRLNTWTSPELLVLAEALWNLPEREFHYVAVDLLAKHHRQLDLDSLPRLLQLVQRQSWWDTVDGLAGVVGDILLRARAGQCDVQRHMDRWLSHSNLWVRRVAMRHQLGWKAQTDEARLLITHWRWPPKQISSSERPQAGRYATTPALGPKPCAPFCRSMRSVCRA